MKKHTLYSISLLSLAVLASCSKQELQENDGPQLVSVAAEISASSSAGTKTIMTEYNEHLWNIGDKISIFYKTADASKALMSNFTSKANIPSSRATFAGTLSLPSEDTDLSTVSAVAVYPVSAEGAYDGESVTVTVPSVQTAVEGTFQEGAFPLVAKTSDFTSELSFKAVCGGIKVSFQTAGITSFTFKGNGGAVLAGAAKVSFDTDGNPAVASVDGGATEITVNAPDGGFEVGKWYYVTALPAKLTGGYTIALSNGKSFSSSKDIEIKRAVFGVLDSKDAPEVYSDLSTHLKSIKWWEANKDSMSEPVPTTPDGDAWKLSLKRNIQCVRFASDASYIYGYVESKVENDDLSWFNNLGLWLDVEESYDSDGKKVVEGGGWLFQYYTYFDHSVYGAISEDGKMVWSPVYQTQTAANGAGYGTVLTTSSAPGYGEGCVENSVFKYSFIIDRRIVGLRNSTSTVIGINFDNGKGISGENIANPDKSGYTVPLKNSGSADEYEPAISLKSFADWQGIEYQTIKSSWTNKADTKVKFDSDAYYLYGYIEIENTDALIAPNISREIDKNTTIVYNAFCPGFIKKLAVGFDLDGVETDQGIGWMTNPACYEKFVVGDINDYTRSAITDEEAAQGWIDLWDHFLIPVSSYSESLGRPGYSITPKEWKPTVNESTGGIGTQIKGTENWNIATGKGEWVNKTFRYTFTIERRRLGLKGLDKVKLCVFLYENGIDGYSVTPDAAGFEIKLNN